MPVNRSPREDPLNCVKAYAVEQRLNDLIAGTSALRISNRILGMYFAKYNGPGSSPPQGDLTSIPAAINLVYGFQAGPVDADSATYPAGSGAVAFLGEGGGPGSYADNAVYGPAWWTDQVQTIRGRGCKFLVSLGGAGAYVDLSTTANVTRCFNSIVQISNDLGGIDGIDFNLETTENGLAVYPSNMVSLALQLRAQFGSGFVISMPSNGDLHAPYLQHDIDIATALNNADCLDFLAPQVYDGFGTDTESQKISTVLTVLNYWASITDDWSKLGIGFSTNSDGVFTSSLDMLVQSSYVAFDELANEHPEIRGCFHFDDRGDEAQNYLWTTTLAPRVASTASSSSGIPPIILVDLFDGSSIDTTKWNASGTVSESGGNLVLPITGYGSGPNQVLSKLSYNIVTNSVQFKLGSMPFASAAVSGGTTIYEAYVEMKLVNASDANSFVTARLFSDASEVTLEARYQKGVSNPVVSSFNLAYTPGTTRYFKFYSSIGYLFLATAPDVNGIPGPWTVVWLASLTTDLPAMNSMQVLLHTDGYSVTSATIDDFGTTSTAGTGGGSPNAGAFTTLEVDGLATIGGDIDLTGNIVPAGGTQQVTGILQATRLASPQMGVRDPSRNGVKAWNYDFSTVNSGGAITAGKFYLLRLDFEEAANITNLYVCVNTAQTGAATAGQNGLALLDHTGTLLASGLSDTLFTVLGVRSIAITSTPVTPGNPYYVEVLGNWTAPGPSLLRANPGNWNLNFGQTSNLYSYASQQTLQTALATVNLSSNNADGAYWAAAG